MKNKIYSSALIVTTLLPTIVFAQTSGAYGSIDTFLNALKRWIPTVTGIIFGLAIIGFLWGLMKFIFAAGSEDARESGKNIMVWGLVAIFVMASVWGIVRLAQQTLGVDNNTQINPPIFRPQ